jgi:hypothetical protein
LVWSSVSSICTFSWSRVSSDTPSVSSTFTNRHKDKTAQGPSYVLGLVFTPPLDRRSDRGVYKHHAYKPLDLASHGSAHSFTDQSNFLKISSSTVYPNCWIQRGLLNREVGFNSRIPKPSDRSMAGAGAEGSIFAISAEGAPKRYQRRDGHRWPCGIADLGRHD